MCYVNALWMKCTASLCKRIHLKNVWWCLWIFEECKTIACNEFAYAIHVYFESESFVNLCIDDVMEKNVKVIVITFFFFFYLNSICLNFNYRISNCESISTARGYILLGLEIVRKRWRDKLIFVQIIIAFFIMFCKNNDKYFI